MSRFNLLPWRESRRGERKREFWRLLALSTALGLAIVIAMGVVNSERVARQEERNRWLKSEIALLDARIHEIRDLRQQIDALNARRAAVEQLQQDRSRAVRLLSELAARVPRGIVMKSIKQGEQLSVSGYAMSNALVSELLRSLEAGADWLGHPQLVEIKSASVGQGRDVRRVFEFVIALDRPAAGGGKSQ